MAKPKLDTFANRIKAVMIDAGVEPDQLEAKIAEICNIKSVSDWFSNPSEQPPAVDIATLSVAFNSDCVWLITGKFSSVKAVCDRYDAEVFSCTLASSTVEAKGVQAREVKVTQNFKN